jgi:hypothetical protein
VLCVVRYRSLRRADHSSREVLPTVMHRCVWSWNLKNEEAMARTGTQRHRKKYNNNFININWFIRVAVPSEALVHCAHGFDSHLQHGCVLVDICIWSLVYELKDLTKRRSTVTEFHRMC